MPAIAQKRLVVVRDIEKLSQHNKDLILTFIASNEESTDLILDTNQVDSKNSFIKKVAKSAKIIRFAFSQKVNVFDMTKLMMRNPAEAIKILSKLVEDGSHPLQILGGIVWFWGNSRNRLGNEEFKKGLLALQEADLNIKRSRLKAEYAVEIAVTKLSLLIAC